MRTEKNKKLVGIKFIEETGRWQASFSKRHPATKQSVNRSRMADSKEEAIELRKTLKIEVEAKIQETRTPMWRRVCEMHREARLNEDLSKATVENCFLCLKAHTFDDWGRKPIDSITTRDIRDMIKVKVAHRSVSHQKNMLKFIRGVFRFALEEGIVLRDPCPKMTFRFHNKLKGTLTEKQAGVFLNHAKVHNEEWYPLWATAIYTGMRSGELYALTWDKVNFETKQILVDSSWNSKDGFKSTKSGDDRMIEIAPNLIPILKELQLQSQDSVFVLPRIEAWEKGRQAEELRRFLKGLALPEIRFHDLRATWATLLLAKGVPALAVMTAGGWRNIKTMNIYIRKAGVDIRGMMDGMDLHDPSKTYGAVLDFRQNH